MLIAHTDFAVNFTMPLYARSAVRALASANESFHFLLLASVNSQDCRVLSCADYVLSRRSGRQAAKIEMKDS